ncbi:hypothetical protein BP6252_10821 [Coleophoma cylindrospora]|uniref:Heterokaryon incompatibility domain-containing protein n=1 Tax=Coleophoma cylindrospora TaxID=1849047 RepID=A0A3D8QN81_9HELO|nr:hypothetical protein BP6252_10821 [Coleophoma cylindrospora]
MDGPYYRPVTEKQDLKPVPRRAGLSKQNEKDSGSSYTTYQDIRTPRDRITASEIRLLRLRPGYKDDDLSGNIERYTFHHDPTVGATYGYKSDHGYNQEKEGGEEGESEVEVDQLPEYEALSYTWGDDKIVGTIKILEGGKMYEIGLRQNLMAALKMLRHPPRNKESRAEIRVLRDQARADPKYQFRLLQQKVQEKDQHSALRYLRLMLPEIPDDGHRNYIDEALNCEYHSAEEDRAIQEFKEMVSKEWYDDESRHRYLWIDSICIDQLDKEEKSRQIPRMSDIYMKAKEVCVWLGEEISETRSDIAMDFVPEVLKNWEDIDKILDPHKETQWDAFITLLRRPWFSRRWIVQELTRARHATIYCGTKRVKWEQFADVIALFKQYQLTIQDLFKRSVQLDNDPDRIGDLDELSAIRLVHASDHLFRRAKGERITEKLLPLEGLMSTLTAFEASEPKDTIYAIVWLARDATPVSKQTSEMESNADDQKPNLSNNTISRPIRLPSRAPSRSRTPPPLRGGQRLQRLNADIDPQHARLDNIEPAELQRKLDSVALSSEAATEPAQSNEKVLTPVSDRDTEVNKEDELDIKLRRLEKGGVTLVERILASEARGIPAKDFWENEEKRQGIEFRTKLSHKRFLIDYQKSLFEVCYDFLRFSVERSGRLDLLCRPWAPEPSPEDLKNEGQLPSWIRRLSEHRIFSKHSGGPMERINADPLVGRPGTGEKHFYSADRNIRAIFKTLWTPAHKTRDPQDWMTIRINREDKKEVTKMLKEKRCLIVRGFVLDQVSRCHPAARGGCVPVEWIKAIDWLEPGAGEPPDIFWRTLVGNRDHSGDRAPQLWKRACQQEFKKRVGGGDLNIKRLLLKSGLSEPTRLFLKRVESVIYRRSLLELKYNDLFAAKELDLLKAAKKAEGPSIKEPSPEREAQPSGIEETTVTPVAIVAPSAVRDTMVPGVLTPSQEHRRSRVSSRSPKPISQRQQTFFLPKPKEEQQPTSQSDVNRRGLALGPCEAQEGDIIVIIFGCSVPVLLRKVVEDETANAAPWAWKPAEYDYHLPRQQRPIPEDETHEQRSARAKDRGKKNEQDQKEHRLERFQIIGECYVHEKMDGEAWTVPNIYQEIRQFTIV